MALVPDQYSLYTVMLSFMASPPSLVTWAQRSNDMICSWPSTCKLLTFAIPSFRPLALDLGVLNLTYVQTLAWRSAVVFQILNEIVVSVKSSISMKGPMRISLCISFQMNIKTTIPQTKAQTDTIVKFCTTTGTLTQNISFRTGNPNTITRITHETLSKKRGSLTVSCCCCWWCDVVSAVLSSAAWL